MSKDLMRDMLGRAPELLTEGLSIVEWFDPKSFEHRGAFRIFLETNSWPENFIPENVTVVPGFRTALVKKLNEAFPDEDIESKLPEWAQNGIRDVVQSMESGEAEQMTLEWALDIVAQHAYAADALDEWMKIREDVKLVLEKYGIMEGKVPSKDDDQSKMIKKLTEAGIQENSIREFWIVIKPQSDSSTLDDLVSKCTPRKLMTMAKGGMGPEDLVGIYDDAIEARKIATSYLPKSSSNESKINENQARFVVRSPDSNYGVEDLKKELDPEEFDTWMSHDGQPVTIVDDTGDGYLTIKFEDGTVLSMVSSVHVLQESKIKESPDKRPSPKQLDNAWTVFVTWDPNWKVGSEADEEFDIECDSELEVRSKAEEYLKNNYQPGGKIVGWVKRPSGWSVGESKLNEAPLGAETPGTETNVAFKDPGFGGVDGKLPGEKEETPEGDLDLSDEEEDATEAEFDKIYLGQDDTTHYYVVAKKGEEGTTEDLLVTDQEGKELFSAQEEQINTHDIARFILAALDSDKVKIRELERSVVLQYLVPHEEEEIATEEEEDEEGVEGMGGETEKSSSEEEPPTLDQERPMESRKAVSEKKLSETLQVKDAKGNTFSVQIIGEGTKDTVVQVNNREFRFKPAFVSLYEMEDGKLTESGLQDMVTELLSHLRDDEYAEVVGSGIQESSDEEDHCPKCGSVLNWIRGDQKFECPKCGWSGDSADKLQTRQSRSNGVQEDLDPSVTKEVGEDALLQRVQQLRAKKDRTPDDETTLRQLEDELKTRGQTEEGKVPSKDDDQSKMIKKLTERTTPRVGDIVQIKDKEDKSTVIPHAKVAGVTTTEPEGTVTIQLEGEEEWWDSSNYLIKILEPVDESKLNENGLAKKAGKKPEDFEKNQLASGTKVETEHTSDKNKAQQIAMDHLTEDPRYYKKLKKMEAGKCGESNVREGEYTDMAAGGQTKQVFEVDFVLENGENRQTRVMATDEFEAKNLLKKRPGIKSVVGAHSVKAHESKTE